MIGRRKSETWAQLEMWSIDAQIAEVEYELQQRREVYPRIIAKNPSRASSYGMHEQRMRAVLGTLRWLKDHESAVRTVARKGLANDDLDNQQAGSEILR
jgi:hypothetical protein